MTLLFITTKLDQAAGAYPKHSLTALYWPRVEIVHCSDIMSHDFLHVCQRLEIVKIKWSLISREGLVIKDLEA